MATSGKKGILLFVNHLEGFSLGQASRLIPQKAHPNISKNSWDMVVSTSHMDIYGHLFEKDHRHVVSCLDDAQMTQTATQPQSALEVIHTVRL
jgi:hypothetical protein